MLDKFFNKEKPFTGFTGFGGGYLPVTSSSGTGEAQFFTVSTPTLDGASSGAVALVDSVKVQSDGIIVSGRYHAAKFTKDGSGTLTATNICRVWSSGTSTINYSDDNCISLATSTSGGQGGTYNIVTNAFSNYNRRGQGNSWMTQQNVGRNGTFYSDGGGYLDGSSGDFKAYWMHSTQTTFDSFSDGNFGNSYFAYSTTITNDGTDYFCAIDDGSGSATRNLLLVTGPTTSQDVKHNVRFNRSNPTVGWVPDSTNIGPNFNRYAITNAYVTSTDSYIHTPAVGVVRISGSGASSRQGHNFASYVTTGIGDYDSSNYLLTLTGRSGNADEKYTYLLKRAAGNLSSANTGDGYKITNKNSSDTDFGLIGTHAVRDSATNTIYWTFIWQSTTDTTYAGVLALADDFSSSASFTVGSNIITVAPETGTFNSTTANESGGGSTSNNNYSTTSQTDSLSTASLSSNYTEQTPT